MRRVLLQLDDGVIYEESPFSLPTHDMHGPAVLFHGSNQSVGDVFAIYEENQLAAGLADFRDCLPQSLAPRD
jgi:hypothetical protein